MSNSLESLELIPLSQLDPHPSNSNRMAPDYLAKLAANIGRTRRYPPLVVRPLPSGRYQILDGEQRSSVLRELGEVGAWCYLWPCDDHDALILMATLNRLEGQDVPARRAALIRELQANESLAALAILLPESEAELGASLALLDIDLDALLARLSAESERAEAALPVLFSFAIDPTDAPQVQQTLDAIESKLTGKNRRGRALVELVSLYASEAVQR